MGLIGGKSKKFDSKTFLKWILPIYPKTFLQEKWNHAFGNPRMNKQIRIFFGPINFLNLRNSSFKKFKMMKIKQNKKQEIAIFSDE